MAIGGSSVLAQEALQLLQETLELGTVSSLAMRSDGKRTRREVAPGGRPQNRPPCLLEFQPVF